MILFKEQEGVFAVLKTDENKGTTKETTRETIRHIYSSEAVSIGISSLISLFSILAWKTGHQATLQTPFDFRPCSQVSPFLFFLTGLSLFFVYMRSAWKKLVVMGLSTITGVVSLAIFTRYMSQYFSDLNLFVTFFHNSTLFRLLDDFQRNHGGRVAFETSVALVILNFLLLLLNSSKRFRSQSAFLIIITLFSVVLGFGITNLLIAVIRSSRTVVWEGYVPMHSFAAIQLILLSYGLLGAILIKVPYKLDLKKEKYRPVIILSVGVVVIFLQITHTLFGYDQKRLLAEQHKTLDNIAYKIQDNLFKPLEALERMAARWNEAGPPNEKAWLNGVSLYRQYFPGFVTILWVDSQGKVRRMFPESHLSQNLSQDVSQDVTITRKIKLPPELFRKSLETDRIIKTSSQEILPEEKGFFFISPVKRHDVPDGFLAMGLNEEDLVTSAIWDIKKHNGISINEGGNPIVSLDGTGRSLGNTWTQSTKVDIPLSAGAVSWTPWQITIAPTWDEIAFLSSGPLFIAILLIGIFMAYLLGKIQLSSINAKANASELSSLYFSLMQQTEETKQAQKLIEEQRAQGINAAKMASLGQLAAGIAHEINNPLGAIMCRASELCVCSTRGILTSEKAIQISEHIQATAERIAKIITNLKAFSRECESDPFLHTSVCEIIDNTFDLCQARFKHHTVDIRIKKPEQTLQIECREFQIVQVLTNLLNNAFDAVEGTPNPWIELDCRCSYSGNRGSGQGSGHGSNQAEWVDFRVTDSGSGIPTLIAEKIMEPFFTTKDTHHGTGLGLSISQSIAKAHHGSLFLDSSCSNTSFVLRLPKIQFTSTANSTAA